MIAYPGNDTGILALQRQYGAKCFAWGRKYGNNGLTVRSAGSTAPSGRTMAVDGGSCNEPRASCYKVPGATGRYDDPRNVIAAINALQPGQWMTIQAYVLVTGTTPPYVSNTDRWNCTASKTARHWTNDNERYCLRDYKAIISALVAKGIRVVGPLRGHRLRRPRATPRWPAGSG
jgi:hypothetical protein